MAKRRKRRKNPTGRPWSGVLARPLNRSGRTVRSRYYRTGRGWRRSAFRPARSLSMAYKSRKLARARRRRR